MEATTQYFGKWFFYKQVLEFYCPSKFLCQTSGRLNHCSLVCQVDKTTERCVSEHSAWDFLSDYLLFPGR
jgi:hypothetical protein